MTVKVHFAGREQVHELVACDIAGVNNVLYSAYTILCKRIGLPYRRFFEKKFKYEYNELFKTLSSQKKSVICDSGVFSLAYGRYRKQISSKFVDLWENLYIEHIYESKCKNIHFIEMDMQDLIGVEETRKIRRKIMDVRKDIITVFHPVDGQKGLDEIIEVSEYVAFSWPSMKKQFGKNNAKDKILRLVQYSKQKKQSLKIHLLGCTDFDVLKPACDLVDTCDSITWISRLISQNKTNEVKKIKLMAKNSEVQNKILEEVRQYMLVEKLSDNARRYVVERALGAFYSKKEYEKNLGSQD